MRRLSLALLALTAISHGRIPTLGPPQDVNGAVNPSQFVVVPWGSPNLVGIDESKRRLIRCGYDSPRSSLSLPTVVLMENLPDQHQVLAAELDSHPGPEVILLAGDRCHIWSSGARTTDGLTPDISFDLPAAQRSTSSPAVVADFDADGFPDLLLPATGHIVFSLGTTTAAAVALPDLPAFRLSTAGPWRTGGPAVIAFENPYAAIPTTRVVEFQPNRTPQTVEVFGGTDFLVDLDGIAPPERIRIEYANGGSNGSRILVIRQKSGDIWATCTTLPFPAGNAFFDGPSAIADFNQDGRQELILTAIDDLLLNETPINNFWKIGAEGPLQGTTLTQLDGTSGQLLKIEPVRLPQDNQFGLAQFHQSRVLADAIGNPVHRSGMGIRASLRRQPLIANPPFIWHLSFNEIPSHIATAMLDGDGLPDLVIAGKSGSAIYHSGPYYNREGGKKASVKIGTDLSGVELADMEGDGVSDSLFAKSDSLATLQTYRNPDGSAFFRDPSSSSPFKNFNAPAPNRLLGTADFDGDGDNDALILEGADETLAWSPNDGKGSFHGFHPIALAGREYRIPDNGGIGTYQWIDRTQTLILDVDRDGDPDIITLPSALGNRLALHRNQSGNFTLESFGPAFSQFPDMGDYFYRATDCALNRGKFLISKEELQVVLLAPGSTGFGDPGIRVWVIGGPPGNLRVSNPMDLPHAAIAITADFDSDGIDDFISATAPETDFLGNPVGGPAILFHRNRGNGSVDPPLALAAPTGFVSNLEVADLNGDGKPDLIAASNETGNVDVYLQQGVDPLPPYQQWISLFDVADTSPHADPDGDGMVNLLEYASGTAPGPLRSATSPLKPASVASGIKFPWPSEAVAVHTRPRQPDGSPLDIGIESSTDLARWWPVVATPTIGSSFESPDWEILRWQFETNDVDSPAPRFYRFRVSRVDD